MAFKVLLYESNRFKKPVESFIKSLNSKTTAKVVHQIDLLEKFGNFLSFPHSKKIANNLFELRIRGQNEIRIFYTFKNNNTYLLHAFQKKTQKTPSKEIRIAMSRIKLI